MESRTADAEALVRYAVTSIVEYPNDVSIARKESSGLVTYEISVNPDDVGKVIGRQGRIVKALRTLARAVGSVSGQDVTVEVLD